MPNINITPDFIFESSWEVCNKVGGIYTVLSTKAGSLRSLYKDDIIFIGPDLSDRTSQPDFKEMPRLLSSWRKQAETDGLKLRVGRWEIPGRPIAVLVDFSSFYAQKNQIYTNMWEWFGVDSLRGWGDYDESCMFAVACGEVIRSYMNFSGLSGKNVIAQFNEWTTGMGLLYCKHYVPEVSTIFTTHATSVGRSIAGNNLPLYDFMADYNSDQMAKQLNMVSKHSLEKISAREADCFTTVSDMTARECKFMLGVAPDVVTPNGFEDMFVKKGINGLNARKESRKVLSDVAEAVFGYELAEDTLFVGIGGRYEFRNKGIDAFIDSMFQLKNYRLLQNEVVAVIMVPGDVSSPRTEIIDRLNKPEEKRDGPIYMPFLTHWLNNIESDQILKMIRFRGFRNSREDKVKILFVPCYLNGNDGIFNKTYYDMLCGMDLTVFPSYYEPWGYTPLESIAFSVPTITTNLTGFGDWALKRGDEKGLTDGVAVVKRSDHNYQDVVKEIAITILDYTLMSPQERLLTSKRAKALSEKALWPVFITEYEKAYSLALKSNNRKKQINII
jgi:glycosyltransferase involved in cell wall biosynthesis